MVAIFKVDRSLCFHYSVNKAAPPSSWLLYTVVSPQQGYKPRQGLMIHGKHRTLSSGLYWLDAYSYRTMLRGPKCFACTRTNEAPPKDPSHVNNNLQLPLGSKLIYYSKRELEWAFLFFIPGPPALVPPAATINTNHHFSNFPMQAQRHK